MSTISLSPSVSEVTSIVRRSFRPKAEVTTSLACSGPSSKLKSGSEGGFSASASSAGSSGIEVTAATTRKRR